MRAGPVLLALALSAGFAANCSPARQPAGPCPDASPPARVSDDLEPFLTSYFSSWSSGDMGGYRGHFHDDAIILFIDGGDVRARMPLEPFVDEQASMQREPETRAVERMTGFRADEDRHAATVTVDWLLERGEQRQRGVDRFTLIRDRGGRWRIAALIFYVTDRGREPD